MKKLEILIPSLLLVFMSCSKNEHDVRQKSSYTIINATSDISSARTYLADHDIPWKTLPTTDAIAQYRSSNFGAWAGNNMIRVVNGADTTQLLYGSSKIENLEPATWNTFFLCGNAIVGYDGIFIKNEALTNYADSVIGIRFINLSSNSTPISVVLFNANGTVEVNSIAYKQKSAFINYPSKQATDSIRFILKDVATGDSLTKYVLPKTPTSPYTTVSLAHSRFKNITLVIKGLQGTTSGVNAFAIFPVPHY